MRKLKKKNKTKKIISRSESFKHIVTFIIFNLFLICFMTCGFYADLEISAIGIISSIFIIFALFKKLTENIILIGWISFITFFIILMLHH